MSLKNYYGQLFFFINLFVYMNIPVSPGGGAKKEKNNNIKQQFFWFVLSEV